MRARTRSALKAQSATRKVGEAAATRRNPWWGMADTLVEGRAACGLATHSPTTGGSAPSVYQPGDHGGAEIGTGFTSGNGRLSGDGLDGHFEQIYTAR